MVISHGFGGSAKAFSKQFGPYAVPYDIIMIFGQAVEGWDDTAYTGPLYDTN